MDKERMKEIMKQRHVKASGAINGVRVQCPTCGKEIVKNRYGQIFCCKNHAKYYSKIVNGLKDQLKNIRLCTVKTCEKVENPFRGCNGQELKNTPSKFISFLEIGELAFYANRHGVTECQ